MRNLQNNMQGETSGAQTPEMAEEERTALIKENLEKRLVKERGGLSHIFAHEANIEFDVQSGHWKVTGLMDESSPLGGQSFVCALRAGSPYSRAGELEGFKVQTLSVAGETLYDSFIDKFSFSFIPAVAQSEDQSTISQLPEDDLAVFDPNAGEILHHGLRKPMDLVGIGHEIFHAKLERSKRRDIAEHYQAFEKMLGDKAYAIERLESGDPLSEDQKAKFSALKNYQISQTDMSHIQQVLMEELRADSELLRWLETRKSVVFPNDPTLKNVKELLSEYISTYVAAAKSIGSKKFLSQEEEQKIINLKYPSA